MKSKEEIEQLADKFATSIYGFRNENHNSYLECKRNCIEFYTQCQEDMAIEIAELKIICQEYSKDVKALNDMLSLNKQKRSRTI